MNAISTIPAPMPLQDMQTLAVAIAKSNLFGIKTPEQALVLMAIAQAEGRHPVEAARDYDIINGRPAKKAEAMLRDFILAGGKVAWHALTDELADATFTHPQTGEVRIDWDMKRAMTAFGKKDMYAKFPRQMLRSRVVSEGVRTLWPLATSGMYVPEEQADIPAKETPHTGSTIDGEPPADARKALNDSIPLKSVAATMPRGESVQDTTVYDTADDPADDGDVCPKCQGTGRYRNTDKPCFACDGTGNTAKKPVVTGKDTAPAPERTREAWVMWINGLIQACDKQTSREGIEAIAARPSVEKALAAAPPWAKDEIDAIIGDYMAKLPALPPADDLDEVVIKGEEHLAAG
jgi:hypothetical protein